MKREDLAHTGSHKLNNVIGQALLAQRMGKRRLVAETGAGQHGVASATAAALFGLECTVYMGEVDMARQELNVFRMELLGAEVRPVTSGSRTLKDAVNEALRDWVATVDHTHYCLGSVMGPHPYPVDGPRAAEGRGHEARAQCLEILGGATRTSWSPASAAVRTQQGPSRVSSSTGAQLVGVEAAGGAAMGHGVPGRASRDAVLFPPRRGGTDPRGRVDIGRARLSRDRSRARSSVVCRARAATSSADDEEVLRAFSLLSETEGIIPALEPAHALAWVIREAGKRDPRQDRPCSSPCRAGETRTSTR